MGTWQLEVARMALYMAFPVALFHYFNQPEVYEESITNKKREIYPVVKREKEQEIRDQLRAARDRREAKQLRELENSMNK
ncbi:protein PET100 homolog, mitochondrial [Athalia rosae]|uniref:protein PET100 homolog, mitochondrial n=1 Tax=Athalia rosae TaxID=37344 RepID=UPI00062594AB|nr:protein PET100 homolog, mitochondrial [Athalia rosae]